MIVRVPASTANLGPGFDALGMALSLHAEIGIVGVDEPSERGVEVDEHHPATVAYRRCGGEGRLWVQSPIPMGRGLGYSGAMRVGGAAAALVERSGGEVHDHGAEVLAVAADLEGHADNVAASLFGGVVATDGSRVVRVPLADDPMVVVWVPDATTTSTDRSRTVLPDVVPFADAVFNVGRTALLVAALAAGDVTVLGAATQDRLHQDRRLADRPASRVALEAGTAAGAWCGWLSGSGPSVALLCVADAAERIAACLPDTGHTKVLRPDHEGAVVVRPAAT